MESKVKACGRMSGSCEDAFLHKGIEKAEITKCLKKLPIVRQVVVMG